MINWIENDKSRSHRYTLSTFPERVDGEERHDADCCDMWINVYLSPKLIQANCISPVDIVCDHLSKILNGNFVRDGAVLTNQVCDLLKVIRKSNKMYNIHGFLSRRQTERNILVVAENLRGRMVTVLKIQLLLNTLQSSSDELKPNQKSDANRRHTYKNMTLSRGGLWSYGRERANNRNILQLKVKIKRFVNVIVFQIFD